MNLEPVLIYSPCEESARRLKDSLSIDASALLATELDGLATLLGGGPYFALIVDIRSMFDSTDVTDVRRCLQRIAEYMASSPRSPAILLKSNDNTLKIPFDCEQITSEVDLLQAIKSFEGTYCKDRHTENVLDDSEQHTEKKDASVPASNSSRFETRSPQVRHMLDDLMIAGAHDVAILLIGETGSGKTFLSRLVHETSPRRDQPFIHVACGALPRDLIESELFGHVKGSFTSAHADTDGKFVAAKQGTILLDEIDVLGPDQQVKLLRVIETGEFEPVGSNQTLKSQARLIFASNLDLEPLVEQGHFRPDLYYRLNMLKFEIPPLRHRKADIVPLSKKFIHKFQDKHNITITRIDDSVIDALLSYPWPGNIRELEHVIQRAVIYCRDGILTDSQLPPHIVKGQVGPTNDPSIRMNRQPIGLSRQSLGSQVELSEKDIIEQALCKNDFSRTNTAKDLGISRVTLYNKMKKYELLKVK